MNKKTILLIAVVLVSVMFIGGCAMQSSLNSEEEVGDTITNISQDVSDVGSALEDIDSTLGGS